MNSFTLTCMAAELTRAINLASQVAGKGKMVPVLKCCVIKVENGSATISATDTDNSLVASIAADGAGEVFLDMEMLAQKANALRGNAPVTITQDGDFVFITQSRTKWKLPVLADPAGFPYSMVQRVDGEPIEISGSVFLNGLSTAHSLVREGTANVVDMGVYLDMDGGFRFVSGGGSGLCVIQVDAKALPHSILVPNKSIRVIGSIFREADMISVTATENAMMIEADGVMYRTQLIGEKFPDWRKIQAKGTGGINGSTIVDASHIVETIERATAIALENSKSLGSYIAVRLTFKDGECEAKSRNKTGEEGVDYCPADGDDGSFPGHAGYIAQTVKSLNADRIRIGMNTEKDAPIRLDIEPIGKLDNYRIIAPMRA